jgi:hypothetical protein
MYFPGSLGYNLASFGEQGKQKTSVISTASVVAIVGSATPQLVYSASNGAVLAVICEPAAMHSSDALRGRN